MLSRPAKVLYTAFSAFTMAGLVSSVALYDRIVRFRANATPHDLYDDLVAHYSSSDPQAYPRLLDATHFHLFSMPVLLLVSGHLFLLTGRTPQSKAWWITAGIIAVAAHLLAPWLAYFGGAALAWLYPITGAALFVALSVLTCIPVWEMWRARRS